MTINRPGGLPLFASIAPPRHAVSRPPAAATTPAPTGLDDALPPGQEILFGGAADRGTMPRVHSLYFAGAQRKIMTYNVENMVANRSGTWYKRPQSTKAVAKAILRENPDVIALQEVGNGRLLKTFNRKYLNNRYPTIVQIPTTPGGMKVAIMARQDFKLVSAQSHWKAQRAIGGYRDFLEATFETPTGYRFTLYTGHFKSMVGGEEKTMALRVAEAQSAARIVGRQLQEDPQARIIVAGDLNTIHDTPFGKPVLAALARVNDADPDNDLTEVILKDNKTTPTHLSPPYPPRKLDYAFVSRPMLKDVVRAYVAGSFRAYPWTKASDHLPLVTVIEEPDNLAAANDAPRFAGWREMAKPAARRLDRAA